MRRTHTTSRRGGLTAASAALVCLGGAALTGCGAGQDDGYVAVGTERSGTAERPKDEVSLVPLPADKRRGQDRAEKRGTARETGGAPSSPSSPSPSPSNRASGTPGPGPSGSTGAPSGSSDAPEPSGGDSPGTPPGSGSGSEPPKGPALLKTGKPERAEAEDRWCEKVTVTFRNAGGRPVDSGTVTFGTHVIDALGTDWATRESTRKLPVPIAPGKKKEKTWKVCLDAWRVPLGMHVETRDVKVSGWR
ncbi:hypothetical protein GCM10009801_08200 [Streptomyces albiaxialis]|uniref:Secreted protein n=1 Tax=Streptomyces albiaxialis TaxID=329523 RepID=A0ABN2VJH3_9ACTN